MSKAKQQQAGQQAESIPMGPSPEEVRAAAPELDRAEALAAGDLLRVKVVLGVRGEDRDLEPGEVVEVPIAVARVLGPHVQPTDEPLT